MALMRFLQGSKETGSSEPSALAAQPAPGSAPYLGIGVYWVVPDADPQRYILLLAYLLRSTVLMMIAINNYTYQCS